MKQVDTLPGVAILMLDMARTTLENASQVETLDDAKKGIENALKEIEQVFLHAKRAAAELEAVPDANVE